MCREIVSEIACVVPDSRSDVILFCTPTWKLFSSTALKTFSMIVFRSFDYDMPEYGFLRGNPASLFCFSFF